MDLGEDGNYYFDTEPKLKFQYSFFKPIRNKLMNSEDTIHIEIISGKKFYFELSRNIAFIYNNLNLNLNNKTEISAFPPKIRCKIMENENKEKIYERYIFSKSQYEKTLKYFGITFPWSRNYELNDENINILIYHSVLVNEIIIIEDINIFKINFFNEPENKTLSEFNNNIKKLKDLSKFIHFYIKNEINIYEYEERKFIKEEDFILNIDSEFIVYELVRREQYWQFFEDIKDEYFFTGPHSIGKTFTLLSFSNYNRKKIRKAYFNLEVLKSNKQYFEIIAYEARHLFDDNDSWKNAFIKIKEREPFAIIKSLIKLVSSKITEKFIFILDQIKFQSTKEEDIEFQQIQLIRNIIKQTKNCSLIGCCSINYKGVKDILFDQWFSFNNRAITLNYFRKILTNIAYDNKIDVEYIEDSKENKFLKMLGYLPSYMNIKNFLNKKILNIMIKTIKEKIQHFYNKNKQSSFINLEEIKVNKSFKSLIDFKLFLDKIPFKYFIINMKNLSVNYTYPLVKIAIDELLYTNKLNNFNPNNEFEREWKFERNVIDYIKNTHIFGKHYIDSYYEIPTIYRKSKIKDDLFSNSENILFYFSYVNVRRYNCAIYLYDSKSLILGQIALKKDKKQLDKYNIDNFKKDIDSMQKFLKINKIDVKYYYLLFILDYDNYCKKENYELIESYNFKYCKFNYKKNCFMGRINNYYEINFCRNENISIIEEDEKLLEFGIEENSFIYTDIKKAFRYYSEKGTNLQNFLEQTVDEEIAEKFFETFNYDGNKYRLSKICSLIGKVYKQDIDESEDGTNILFLNLKNGVFHLGYGKIEQGKANLNFHYMKCINTFFHSSDEQNSDYMTGFIFKYWK